MILCENFNLAITKKSLDTVDLKTEKVKNMIIKHVSEIYLQLKLFMQEESLVTHKLKSNCQTSAQKYADFLKHLHDICVVRILTG